MSSNTFQLSPQADPNKVFLVNLSEIEGRLDPLYYASDLSKFTKNIHHDVKSIKNVSVYISSGFAAGKGDQAEDEGIIQIRPTNMDENGYLKFEKNIFLPSELLETSKSDLLRIGEVLFNNTNSQEWVGKTAYFDLEGDYFCSNHITRIAVNEEYIKPKFLWILLNLYQEHKIFYSICTNWNNQSGIGSDLLSRLKIPVPKKDIQNEVVEHWKKCIGDRNNQLAEARRLLSSIDDYILAELGITLPTADNSLENRVFYANFSEVSGGRFDPKLYDNNTKALFKAVKQGKYRKVSLRSLVTHSVAGSWGFDEALPLPEDEYTQTLCIRATEFDNLFNLNLDGSRVKYRQIGNTKLKSMDIQPNDLLIEKSGGSPDQPVGRISILTEEILEEHMVSFSNFIHKIRIDPSVCLPEYLFCFLKTMHNIKVMEAMQSQTNGIRNLIMREYFHQTVILPDPAKQKEIAETAQAMRQKAQELMQQGKTILEQTKREVEQMILGY